MMNFVLASQSPRRQTLIGLLGQPFEVVTSDVDESLVQDPDPAVNVVGTARLKAEAVAERLRAQKAALNTIVVAADTTVALEERMLGKPVDAADARQMLRLLRGRAHDVHTGVVLLDLHTNREISGVNTAVVWMRDYSDVEIEAYIASGDPMDKAGSYAIQAPDFRPAARLDGCFTGVMGLSVCHLLAMFAQLDVKLRPDLTAVAASHQGYACALFDKIAPDWA